MLSSLFGNQNIEKILLFLFVNGKAYGQELSRAFQKPLTPIQKALERLEKGNILSSHYEGKTRLFQLNSAYPLLTELEALLKQAYTLLSPEERKSYCVVKTPSSRMAEPLFYSQANRRQVLSTFWEKLKRVSRLTFRAKTKSKKEGGWNGEGQGEVLVEREGEDRLIFHEKGSWRDKNGGETTFHNIFRWSLDRKSEMISLEHLRRGAENPVFLFHMTPVGGKVLASVDAHLCGEDTYFGQIHLDAFGLRLQWRVIGPKKNEEMDYCYS